MDIPLRFNIGADRPYTVNYLAKMVGEAMGKQVGVEHLQERNEVAHAFCDHGKARELLGYEAKISLEEGIARMTEWVKSIGPRASKDFEGIEIDKNLPPVWKAIVRR